MSGKRNRDNDTNIVSSKTIRNDKTNSIRSEKYTSGGSGGGGSSGGGGGGGGDDGSGNDDGSDEEFINFIVGKYNNHIRQLYNEKEISSPILDYKKRNFLSAPSYSQQ